MTTTEPLTQDVPNESAEFVPAPPVPASLSRRLGNFVLDALVLGVIETFSGSSIAVFLQVDVDQLDANLDLGLFGLALMLCYVLPEWLCGRTVGKLVTGTKVVSLDGERPSFLRIVLRTIVRFVPFEPLSFVFGGMTGWHDDWSRTRVVLTRDPYAAMVKRL